MAEQASKLITQFLPALAEAATLGPVLDLACGGGRNGLALLHEGVDVVFADRSADSLHSIEQSVAATAIEKRLGSPSYWQVDFEAPGTCPLAGKSFGAVLVFRYLHRPLFESLRNAIVPGGLVVYETFTVDQVQYGRPTNPDFLLRHGELASYFADWDILMSAEVVEEGADASMQRAVARIVARNAKTE